MSGGAPQRTDGADRPESADRTEGAERTEGTSRGFAADMLRAILVRATGGRRRRGWARGTLAEHEGAQGDRALGAAALGALPPPSVIQRWFGRLEIAGVQARTGAVLFGADAYAVGNHLVFARTPSLHTSVLEAALDGAAGADAAQADGPADATR